MNIDLQHLDSEQLERAAQHYAEHGFILLSGLEDIVTAKFRPVLADRIGVNVHELAAILNPMNSGAIFPPQVRERLGRIETSPQLAQSLLEVVRPLLTRLIGR